MNWFRFVGSVRPVRVYLYLADTDWMLAVVVPDAYTAIVLAADIIPFAVAVPVEDSAAATAPTVHVTAPLETVPVILTPA